MCRLLAYHSPKPTTFNQLLGDDFQSFVELANQHCDGWGIATSSSTKAKLYKEPLAATASNHFATELATSNSAIALLHLRWATPGLGINQNNTHPFTYQDISFMHNGSITPFDCLDSLIAPEYLALAAGTTDSERYFLYLLTQIKSLGFVDGVLSAISYIKNNCDYTSLNMMISNKDTLICLCLYNLDRVPERFKSTPEYYQINYTTINDCVVVGSSGWNQDNWQELKNSTALIVNSDQSYKVVNL